MVFDETYYVPDAWSILRHGVEWNHPKNVNSLLVSGSTHVLTSPGEYVAHPPLGKAMIAVGEWLFGLTPFGWRFSVAVVGTLAILMTARIMRRMTRSTLLGCVAGLLMALDGLEFVLSRTAILDIFVMFWVLAAFGMLVLDRDASRARLAALAEHAPRQRTRGRRPATRGPVAPGTGRRLPRRRLRDQVERRLVPVRVRRPGDRVGHRSQASARLPGQARRRVPQRRQVAAGLVRVPRRS